MNSLKRNYLYNVIYQVIILIIPLLIIPYISRKLGADGIGLYSFSYSIVYYFMLLTLLGVNNYGNRTIAKIRDDIKELSKNFISIYAMQLFIGTIMLIAYLFYCMFFVRINKIIYLLQSLYIISSILDINWFFYGMEQFKKLIIRNTIVKIISIILIFVFVRNSNDLWKYTLIVSGMTLLSQLVLWKMILKEIQFVNIRFADIKSHIKPNLVLFIPIIAISLYKIMDKIMIGVLSNILEVGYYENAEKIINIPITIISSLGTVMLPRISNLANKKNNNLIEKYIEKSIDLTMFLSFPMAFGLACIGKTFAPIFFGCDFEKSGVLITLLSITIPFISFANVIRTQVLIPKEKDKIYIYSVSIGAIFNLLLNIVFIPIIGSIGACIGTILAEFIVMFYQTMSVRKELDIKKYIKNILPFFIKSFIMFVLVYSFNYIHMNSLLRIFIQALVGGTIYLLLNYKYINSIIDIKKVFTKFRKKVS